MQTEKSENLAIEIEIEGFQMILRCALIELSEIQNNSNNFPINFIYSCGIG